MAIETTRTASSGPSSSPWRKPTWHPAPRVARRTWIVWPPFQDIMDASRQHVWIGLVWGYVYLHFQFRWCKGHHFCGDEIACGKPSWYHMVPPRSRLSTDFSTVEFSQLIQVILHKSLYVLFVPSQHPDWTHVQSRARCLTQVLRLVTTTATTKQLLPPVV